MAMKSVMQMDVTSLACKYHTHKCHIKWTVENHSMSNMIVSDNNLCVLWLLFLTINWAYILTICICDKGYFGNWRHGFGLTGLLCVRNEQKLFLFSFIFSEVGKYNYQRKYKLNCFLMFELFQFPEKRKEVGIFHIITFALWSMLDAWFVTDSDTSLRFKYKL